MSLSWYSRAPEHLPVSVRHEVSATVTEGGRTYDLDLKDVQVTFSEDWSPYAQVSLTIPVPADPVLLDEVLDPRRDSRILVRAGYTYPDGTHQIADLADVGVRERPLRRPADEIALDAGSAEYRAMDYRAMYWADMERAGINEAITWLAGYAQNSPRISSEMPARHGAAQLAEIDVSIGDTYWSLMQEAAQRTNTRVWCDERNVWRIAPRVERTGTPVHRLAVGHGGTITDTLANLRRDEWYNSVLLEYNWRNATPEREERVLYGRALATTGPFAVGTAGYRTYYEKRERPIGQWSANNAAAAMLRTLISRGRTRTITAGAAYWLRPGDTVTVALPTGEEEPHIVQSVTFRPMEGLMDVTTRQPLDVTIDTGE